MQIRKTYHDVNPELLFNEVRDLVRKQGAAVDESNLETYSIPTDSSSFITRATLSFKVNGQAAFRAHVIGSAKGETKLMLDVDDAVFPPAKVNSFQNDLDFVFSSRETR